MAASEAGSDRPSLEPEGLARLRRAARSEDDLRYFVTLVEDLWESLATPPARTPEARHALEVLHDLLLHAEEANRASGLPFPPSEAESWFARFEAAALALGDIDRPEPLGLVAAGVDEEPEPPPEWIWAFLEYRGSFQQIIMGGGTEARGLFLAAALEPLRCVLRRSPVFAVPVESVHDEKEDERSRRRLTHRLVFQAAATADHETAEGSARSGGLTTFVETPSPLPSARDSGMWSNQRGADVHNRELAALSLAHCGTMRTNSR